MQLQIDPQGRLVSKLLQVIEPGGKRILEVGWGEGRVTSLLVGRCRRLTAIDVVVHPTSRDGTRWPLADFVAASGEWLPFSGPCFDVVLFTQSLHHQNSRKAIAEAAGVLRPGGMLVVLEPVAGTELEAVCGLFEDEINARLEALYAILNSGLAVERRETVHTVWRFKDRDALGRWLLDYYRAPKNREVDARIDAILGRKSACAPLDLGESLLMVALKGA